jgi:hypothetical protein
MNIAVHRLRIWLITMPVWPTLTLKDYENAITYLSEFSSDDKMLGPITYGGIGDAFVQLEQLTGRFRIL